MAMNVARYISNKLDGGADSSSFTSSVTKIAIISIAMGLAVMVVSFAILEGFRNEIQAKIFSFGAHLTVSKYDNNNSLEVEPINGAELTRDLRRYPQIKSDINYRIWRLFKESGIEIPFPQRDLNLRGASLQLAAPDGQQFTLSDAGEADEEREENLIRR